MSSSSAPRRHVGRLVAPVLLSLLLAGCASDSDGDPAEGDAAAPGAAVQSEPLRELAAGTCWTDEQLPQALGEDGFDDWVEQYADGDARLAESMRDDASFGEEVDCAEPHALELYAVVALPPALDAEVAAYTDLLDPGTELFGRVRDAVNGACLTDSVWGQAQEESGAGRVQLGPALRPDGNLRLAWDPFPADLWDAGQRSFVCTLEQQEPGTLRFADLATSAVPQPERVCLNIPGEQVRCGAPHQAEEIGEMVLNIPIRNGNLDAEAARRDDGTIALSDAEYARLDRACELLFERVSTGPPDVEAQAFPGSPDQWPNDAGAYVASCFALKPFDPPPPFRGTVFDR